MNKLILSLLLVAAPFVHAQSTSSSYTNFIRQKQLPSGVVWDMPVAVNGESQSALAINPGGAQFELWTVNNAVSPVKSYLLESRYVASYVPMATVAIRSEDPYDIVPRTRADRPFYVDVTVQGLLSGASDPDASKKVNFLRHVQSYGTAGTGVGLDRTQATLLSQNYIQQNGLTTTTFAITSIPGADRTKVRGEERYSIFSLADNRTDSSSGLTYTAPAAQLGSQYIQIWPVADGAFAGITANQLIRYKMPTVTVTLNDLYPNSTTYVQAYKGAAQLGKTGTIVPGSSLVVNDTVPKSQILSLADYDATFKDDGQWTMELLTKTPFGIDRLAYVTFTLDRTLQMNASVTTITD
ncbi:hypothetical protein [Luteolibacter soli]|uniref:Uncharacterized protein n=1 Tax=Luteolibacter soli TaxID=3135280 RepID=A0ABU9AQY7_9BACT